MTCRSCGAEIADKAIVCYRCGASTAPEPAPTGRAAESAESARSTQSAESIVARLVAWIRRRLRV